MKKILVLLLLGAFQTPLVAQRARVFEHISPSYAFGDNVSAPSLSYTQTLALGNRYGFKVNTGLRFTHFIVKSSAELDNAVANKSRTLTLLKNTRSSAINIPIGIEFGNRVLAVGINADFIGLGVTKGRDESFFEVNNESTSQELTLTPQAFNFLPAKRGTLNSEGYVSVTLNQNLTIKLGMAYTQTSYDLTFPDPKNQENSLALDSFTENAFRPFVGLQFNFEK